MSWNLLRLDVRGSPRNGRGNHRGLPRTSVVLSHLGYLRHGNGRRMPRIFVELAAFGSPRKSAETAVEIAADFRGRLW